MKAFWDERFSMKEYAYGEAPNVWYAEQLNKIPIGKKALFPAEGEGRNAVYAAQLGWEVTAVDLSEAGQQKALQLAEKKEVKLNYQIASVENYDFGKATYDLIVLIYSHWPPSFRAAVHQKLIEALKPGGTILLEGFHKENLPYKLQNPDIGGPGDDALLYDENLLQSDFKGLDIQVLEKRETTLSEGQFHRGKGMVIRMIAKK